MKVSLINSMGNDLTVVNSARVSFNKKKMNFSEQDEKLIYYLAKHEHTSPFRHCFATFHIKAPIFVARQLAKHQVGMSWNEVSRRYVDDEPEFYFPEKWRKRSKDKKQGSGDAFEDVITSYRYGESPIYPVAQAEHAVSKLARAYDELLYAGVAPEQVRMILPQNTLTEWYWSGSLQSWAHVCNLRCAPDTQEETREIALQLDNLCAILWPVSWSALRKPKGNQIND